MEKRQWGHMADEGKGDRGENEGEAEGLLKDVDDLAKSVATHVDTANKGTAGHHEGAVGGGRRPGLFGLPVRGGIRSGEVHAQAPGEAVPPWLQGMGQQRRPR